MASEKPTSRISDDDLLAKAIPIDESDEDTVSVDEEELEPIELDENDPGTSRMIRACGEKRQHEHQWQRIPNKTGKGATHVKTFVTKLRLDAVEHLDEQINQWLDDHPDYEVKLVTTTIGRLVGKNTEDALFVNVWV